MEALINNIIIRYSGFVIGKKPTTTAIKKRFKPLSICDIDIDMRDFGTEWEVFLTIANMEVDVTIDNDGYFDDDIDERIVNAVHNATGIAKEVLEFIDCDPIDS
jgi:hypothetical protein